LKEAVGVELQKELRGCFGKVLVVLSGRLDTCMNDLTRSHVCYAWQQNAYNTFWAPKHSCPPQEVDSISQPSHN
ncbi:hypothetical protein KUCAC02_018825, partial [Chaenocephalus aceratus]